MTKTHASSAPYQTVTSCRGCGGTPLEMVLSLGETPLANDLGLREGQPPACRYPLDLVWCPTCSLVQIWQVVSPERLFSDYVYFSSFSSTMLRHAEELANELTESEHLDDRSLVVEVASNDGYLLQYFKQRGIRVLGIEPAANIARVAKEEKGIPTLPLFFGADLATELVNEGTHADVLIGANVLAHVPDLNGFACGVKTLLAPHGVAVFEAPYVRDMLLGTEFDTIYHEHQCYFSLTALDRLFARHGLQVVDVKRLPIHGGSLRVSVAHAGSRTPDERVAQLLAEEQAWGVLTAQPYAEFAKAVGTLRTSLLTLLGAVKESGARIVAYGAAAKGVTLATFCGIGKQYLDYVVDRSVYKQGKYFPVDGLPIHQPERLLEDLPEYTLLLTWNFASEILQQQAAYRERGGKFIVPVPSPKVVG